jgi:hypothetical protein
VTVTVHPTLDQRRPPGLVAGRTIMGDVETARRPVYDRPFVVEGTAPARWVATISLYWRGAGLSGRQYVGADQADALARAVAGAEAFIAETDRYRTPREEMFT